MMKTEEVIAYYKGRSEKCEKELYILKKRKSSFAWLRLGAILAIIAAFYLLLQIGILYAVLGVIIVAVVFIQLVKSDLRNMEEINYNNTLASLYKKELESLAGKFPFESGERYKSKDHLYTSDLDIFGEGSLFQYLNRTTSDPGSDVLSSYLRQKAHADDIRRRQEAIKELSVHEDWIRRLQTYGTLNKFTNESKQKLARWIAEPYQFIGFGLWKIIRYLLPAFSISITILFASGIISFSAWLIALLLMAVIVWQIDKVIAPIHRHLDDIAKQAGSLFQSLEMIEQKIFKSVLLNTEKQKLSSGGTSASVGVRKIKNMLDRLDLRYNWMIAIPLNLLLLWDLQQILDLEKWKSAQKSSIDEWINVLANFEALNSLALFHFNNPGYTFPEINVDYFTLEGKNIGHPLIPENRRINNPASLPANGKLMLITGSNMAGKSTYLRSIGINCVLAFCGAPVCATYFKVSLVSIISSMRIEDNLQESTSTFYAELKKLKIVIDHVNRHEKVLILLDEILRGTNSMDRHTGSKALIRQMIEQQSAGIIATHDLELAKTNDDFAKNILNYHFDVQVSNDELYFDYKLKPGICTSMNASILMRKIGIEIRG